MKRLGWAWGLALLMAALSYARPALAARAATVDVDQSELREGPGTGYKLIDKLPRGTPLAASNHTTEGYYKVRTVEGLIGFVKADVLIIESGQPGQSGQSGQAPRTAGGPPVGLVGSQPPGAPPVAPSDVHKPTLSEDSGFKARAHRKHVRIKVLGGYDFFSVSDVNTLLGASVLQFGYNFGGEINYLFTQDLAMVVRFERMFKTVFARDLNTKHTYQMDLGSWPLMTGLELGILGDSKINVHFAVMAGLGLVTGLSATDLESAEPNVTQMGTTTFAGLAKADVSYTVIKSLTAFLELGYRYLRTTQVTPADSPNGSGVFKVSSAYVPVSLDLSGPYFSFGVGYAF